jgi:DNA-binding NarL/FixJ family response regulator
VGSTDLGRRRVPFGAVTIRVVLAEDNALLREGVARLLLGSDEVELVGTAGDFGSLMDLVDKDLPDVVVTDIRMPPTNSDEGIRAATELRTRHPAIGVVVLSSFSEPAYALALLGEGSAARAYLLKERVSEFEELVRAIREVAAGRSVIDPVVVEALVASGPAAVLRARPAHPSGAGGPGRNGHRQEQRRHRRQAGALRTGHREAQQLDLLQARAGRGTRRQPPGQSGPALPGRHGEVNPS